MSSFIGLLKHLDIIAITNEAFGWDKQQVKCFINPGWAKLLRIPYTQNTGHS